MTARGAEFVKSWVAKNVTALSPSDDPLRATNLAARCIAEAAAEGIPRGYPTEYEKFGKPNL